MSQNEVAIMKAQAQHLNTTQPERKQNEQIRVHNNQNGSENEEERQPEARDEEESTTHVKTLSLTPPASDSSEHDDAKIPRPNQPDATGAAHLVDDKQVARQPEEPGIEGVENDEKKSKEIEEKLLNQRYNGQLSRALRGSLQGFSDFWGKWKSVDLSKFETDPLRSAVDHERVDIVQFLLDQENQFTIKSLKGALYQAVKQKHSLLTNLLLPKLEPHVSETVYDLLQACVWEDNLDFLDYLLQNYPKESRRRISDLISFVIVCDKARTLQALFESSVLRDAYTFSYCDVFNAMQLKAVKSLAFLKGVLPKTGELPRPTVLETYLEQVYDFDGKEYSFNDNQGNLLVLFMIRTLMQDPREYKNIGLTPMGLAAFNGTLNLSHSQLGPNFKWWECDNFHHSIRFWALCGNNVRLLRILGAFKLIIEEAELGVLAAWEHKDVSMRQFWQRVVMKANAVQMNANGKEVKENNLFKQSLKRLAFYDDYSPEMFSQLEGQRLIMFSKDKRDLKMLKNVRQDFAAFKRATNTCVNWVFQNYRDFDCYIVGFEYACHKYRYVQSQQQMIDPKFVPHYCKHIGSAMFPENALYVKDQFDILEEIELDGYVKSRHLARNELYLAKKMAAKREKLDEEKKLRGETIPKKRIDPFLKGARMETSFNRLVYTATWETRRVGFVGKVFCTKQRAIRSLRVKVNSVMPFMRDNLAISFLKTAELVGYL